MLPSTENSNKQCCVKRYKISHITLTHCKGSKAKELVTETQLVRSSSSSRMRVIYHNWSATKQRPHPQSVAEISHH